MLTYVHCFCALNTYFVFGNGLFSHIIQDYISDSGVISRVYRSTLKWRHLSIVVSHLPGISIVCSTCLFFRLSLMKYQSCPLLVLVRVIHYWLEDFPSHRANNAENCSMSWRHNKSKHLSRMLEHHYRENKSINGWYNWETEMNTSKKISY